MSPPLSRRSISTTTVELATCRLGDDQRRPVSGVGFAQRRFLGVWGGTTATRC